MGGAWFLLIAMAFLTMGAMMAAAVERAGEWRKERRAVGNIRRRNRWEWQRNMTPYR